MSDKPTLKLVRCYRGLANARLGSVIAERDGTFRRIDTGRLKGCFRLDLKSAASRAIGLGEGRLSRSIFKLGKDYVLEFVHVIRVRA